VLGLSSLLDVVIRVLRWPAILFVLVAMLSVLYRYGPSRQPPVRWRWVTWGGAFAASAWLALSLGFSWYVTNFGSYNKTYGSLGAIIGFMTWIWLSSTVLLLGGQLNAELESQTGHDPTGERKPSRANRDATPTHALPGTGSEGRAL
jgi:membrane protein